MFVVFVRVERAREKRERERVKKKARGLWVSSF